MSEVAPKSSSVPRILVAEDEPQVCDLLSDLIEDDGFEPRCVQTDRDAYAAIREERSFACMVVDVNLGRGTTGYDVARFARRIDPQLPIIYVSGETSEISYEVNGVPGSLFIAKPFTPDELLARLRKVVGDNDD